MRGAFDRLRTAVYGQAVGDALGVPYEFRPRDMFRCVGMTGYGTHNRPAGTWSDDTSMMLATLDSLAANDWHVDVDDMRARFLSWLDGGEYAIDGDVFDRGVTVATALRRGEGATGFYDNGNGSLMRIMPLAFADCGAGDAGRASAITHAHPVSRRCCVAWVTLLRNALEGGGARTLWRAGPAAVPRLRQVGRVRRGHVRGGALVRGDHRQLSGLRACGRQPRRGRGHDRGGRGRTGGHPLRVRGDSGGVAGFPARRGDHRSRARAGTGDVEEGDRRWASVTRS